MSRIIIGMFISGLLFLSCSESQFFCQKKTDPLVDQIVEWNQFLLKAETHTEGYRAPVAARAFAYIGLAAYETIRPSLNTNYISFQNQWDSLLLPAIDSMEHYLPGIALNQCYAYLSDFFYSTRHPAIQKQKKELEEKWINHWAATSSTESIAYSMRIGYKIAERITQWSATDSYGHLGHLHNYDKSYELPEGVGKWRPSKKFPMPPMLPYWGKVRTFIVPPDLYPAQPLPHFSENPDSIYYQQAMEVYALGNPLSTDNQWIAEYWHDDFPGLTFSHPGHWISIACQVIAQSNASPALALETLLKVGFALSDASVTSWKSKYTYNLERPEAFINRHFSKNWRSHLPSPSHPSYPSGHSTCGAAVTTILAHLYSNEFTLTDLSHQNKNELKIQPRTYQSFQEMSLENSVSRMLLGVHFRIDCEEGRRIGHLVGQSIAQFPLLTEPSSISQN